MGSIGSKNYRTVLRLANRSENPKHIYREKPSGYVPSKKLEALLADYMLQTAIVIPSLALSPPGHSLILLPEDRADIRALRTQWILLQ